MQPGTQLGHYEIFSALGKGGMGEVWRARDQKLGREVAIKTLPEEFARDEERLARFEREAKLLASLNHPNIATIHGLEEDNGTRFLVLELVEGDTLAERLKRGAIPVEESLKFALQIAEALEAAHEKGVIHRDLKPANIKVTPDGKIKVLDFGLAKAFAGDGADATVSNSPTLSMAATQQGVILGTAAYMSPEQARGQEVDKRADVWAFGCVLYEMLTARQVWAGPTVTDMIAAAVAKDPDFTALPVNIHPRIQELLRRCLEKEPKNRWQAIGDVRVEIEQLLADPRGIILEPVGADSQPHSRWSVLTIIAITFIVAGTLGWMMKPEPDTGLQSVVRFPFDLPQGQVFFSGRPVLSLSPDGTKLVYMANDQLHLWLLDELDAHPIPGTDDIPIGPFFSRDSQWVGYFSNRDTQWKKVAISGGAPVPLGVGVVGIPFGASWGPDDTIVFGQPSGIMRVSANEGTSEVLIAVEEGERVTGPQVLPGGEWILFTSTSAPGNEGWDAAEIIVQSLVGTKERKALGYRGRGARYVPTGHITYLSGDSLLAVPFDLDRMEVTDTPVVIVEDVSPAASSGLAQYSFSLDGSLVYVQGTVRARAASEAGDLMWVDRAGIGTPINELEQRRAYFPRLSSNGNDVAYYNGRDLWIYDIGQGSQGESRQFTLDPGDDRNPVWSPNGERLVFSSERDGAEINRNIYSKIVDSTEEPTILLDREGTQVPTSWSTDGIIAFYDTRGGGRSWWARYLHFFTAGWFGYAFSHNSRERKGADVFAERKLHRLRFRRTRCHR